MPARLLLEELRAFANMCNRVRGWGHHFGLTFTASGRPEVVVTPSHFLHGT